jgi:hypothetical protein
VLLAARKATPSHRQAGVVSKGRNCFEQRLMRCQSTTCMYQTPPWTSHLLLLVLRTSFARPPYCAYPSAELQMPVGAAGFPEIEAASPHLLEHAERRAHGRNLLPRAAAR